MPCERRLRLACDGSRFSTTQAAQRRSAPTPPFNSPTSAPSRLVLKYDVADETAGGEARGLGGGERRAYNAMVRVGAWATPGVSTSGAAMPGATMLGKGRSQGGRKRQQASSEDATKHVTEKSAFHAGPLCANRFQEVKLVFRPTSKIWPFRSSYGKNTGPYFLSSFHQSHYLKKVSKGSHERFKVQATLWALVVRDCTSKNHVPEW
jgi:hypothetical protein